MVKGVGCMAFDNRFDWQVVGAVALVAVAASAGLDAQLIAFVQHVSEWLIFEILDAFGAGMSVSDISTALDYSPSFVAAVIL
jgi:hypothetical protein